MNRRRFLASASAAASLALAGCTSGQDDEPSTTTEATDTTTPQTTTPTTTTDDGPLAIGDEVSLFGESAMTVAGASASAFVVSRDGAERAVHSGNTTRYVHVTFDIDAIDDYETFVAENVTLQLNDETFTDPVFPLGGGRNQFVAAYPVPNDLTPFTGSVVLDTGDASATWEFDARAIEDVTQTVNYAVTNVAAPDSVAAESSFAVDLTVSNDGDPMEFVTKVFGTSSAPFRESFDVEGGSESTLTLDLTAPSADGDSEFEFSLDWGARTVNRTVAFE